MGITYRYHEPTRLSVSVWDGEISTDERQRHMAVLASDEQWGTGGRLLTDLTGVTSRSRPSAAQVLDAATVFLSKLSGRARATKWAIVADATFAEAQQFGACIEEVAPRVIVFNDLATAATWLGVDTAQVRKIVAELRSQLRSQRSTRSPS
jgi:hypothetical protein